MDLRNIHLYRGRKSDILSSLTANDATFWGADIFVGVIFALFVTQSIEGGTATHVGIVWAIYRLTRALLAMPLGRFFDKHKGYLDELWALSLSGLIVGVVYMLLFFATDLWHVYVAMVFVAVGHAINLSSWKILFYGNISKSHQGQVLGIYETVMQIVYAMATALAGFLGDSYGFEWTMFVAGVITILSGIIPLMIKSSFR